MDQNSPTYEERQMILRDKAAREGFVIPDDVIDYIAGLYSVPQTLKGGLINVAAHAMRRNEPVTLELARRMLEGIRGEHHAEEPVVEAKLGLVEQFTANQAEKQPVAQPEQPELIDFVASPAEEPVSSTNATEIPLPGFLQTGPSVMRYESESVTLFDLDPIEGSYDELLLGDDAAESEPASEPTPMLDPVTEPAVEPAPAATSQASAVYFAPMRTERKRSFVERAGLALQRAGLAEVVSPGDHVAVKVHFGEKGNTGFISPIYIREVVRLIKELGGKPFLTDANTLYSGQRANATDHITCALQNGFSYATVDAPIIIADGLHGRDAIDVTINGKHCETVRIGSAAVEADAMVVISHIKGHGEAGFGGAIKNVGMGLGSRSAKQRMHSDVKPRVTFDKCTRCKRCIEWCPVHCISFSEAHDNKAYIHKNECIGCGECVAACSYDAIAINWQTEPAAFQEKMVEHVIGALDNKKDKTIFLSFLTNITPECDCWSFSDAAVVPDLGLMASRDIVAIDQAAYDMVTEAVGNVRSLGEGMVAGQDKFHAMHGVDGTMAIAYAEECNLGSRTYDIKRIG